MRPSSALVRGIATDTGSYIDCRAFLSCSDKQQRSIRYRRAQDTLGGFIYACIRTCEGSEVRARTLYEEYLAYCNDNLLSPMSETKFGRDFSTRGFVRSKDKVSRKYVGIKLKK